MKQHLLTALVLFVAAAFGVMAWRGSRANAAYQDELLGVWMEMAAADEGVPMAAVSTLLFDSRHALDAVGWEAFGASANVREPHAFAECVRHRRNGTTLMDHLDAGRVLQIEEVPAVFLNGRPYGGGLSSRALEGEVKKALRAYRRF